MRNVINKVVAGAVMLVAAVGLSAAPAFADGGGSPINATDGRYAPVQGDRIAVYLHDSSLSVWGIDANLNGTYLTEFSLAELTSGKTVTHQTANGTVTLVMNSPATFVTGYTDDTATDTTTEVEDSAVYTITWTGGADGANGSAAFSKTFEATYLP
jgi:hypothetical protein